MIFLSGLKKTVKFKRIEPKSFVVYSLAQEKQMTLSIKNFCCEIVIVMAFAR